ncbi:MAG TPA: ADP-ribosylglycohydrolase family protein, partial [Tepidisphaeraceae bacterium]|nr:ADP-ribosylglycohydrolase family protein [Tepidisphaeraceae bacterium]
EFGSISRLISQLDLDEIQYTDDMQMTIGICECLLEKKSIEPDHLAQCFKQNYDPGRGYGQGAQQILDAMSRGEDWKHLVRTQFPDGSYGNGAAMRVAPIGLAFFDNAASLRSHAQESAKVTHLHPLGIDGAMLVASAVSLLVRSREFNPEEFFAQLHEVAATEEFQWQLTTAGRLGADEMISFGSSLPAHRSVTTAITCFTGTPNSYIDTISRAIALGDDTDTVAAIAGALSGAYLGINAVPKHLLEKLENGPKGRDYIDALANELYSQFAAPHAPSDSGRSRR